MKQARAEELADEIVNYYRSHHVCYREAIIEHLIKVNECNGCPSITDALNSGNGTYKP